MNPYDKEKSLENCTINNGQLVYWSDPEDITSGIYTVCGNYVCPSFDEYNPDDRIIDIINDKGSQAQVYPCELYIIKH